LLPKKNIVSYLKDHSLKKLKSNEINLNLKSTKDKKPEILKTLIKIDSSISILFKWLTKNQKLGKRKK